MLSAWRCKFESVEKCESGWSKAQYICNTKMLTLKDKVCYYSITHSSASSSNGSHVSLALQWLPAIPPKVWLTGLEQDGPPNSTPSQPAQSTLLLLGGV